MVRGASGQLWGVRRSKFRVTQGWAEAHCFLPVCLTVPPLPTFTRNEDFAVNWHVVHAATVNFGGSGGQRSHHTEVRFGGLAEASFLSPSVNLVFYFTFLLQNWRRHVLNYWTVLCYVHSYCITFKTLNTCSISNLICLLLHNSKKENKYVSAVAFTCIRASFGQILSLLF